MKTYKKINMHVFPKTFVVVMMHNCKALFLMASVQNRPFITDHSKQTTFITGPFITDPFIIDYVYNRPRS